MALDGTLAELGGDVIVRRSQFSGNLAGGVGGAAILVENSSFVMRIEDSLFDANVTTSDVTSAGGAVDIPLAQESELIRTRFSSNRGPLGAALNTRQPMRLIDSHLFDNTATRGGGAVRSASNLLVERSTFESNRVTAWMRAIRRRRDQLLRQRRDARHPEFDVLRQRCLSRRSDLDRPGNNAAPRQHTRRAHGRHRWTRRHGAAH